jgi:aryl-alcohol dehydrogenase-like predicted oxidoreductase
MKYRRLGKTGLKVSAIGIGTWQLGGEWGKNFSPEEVSQMFDAAREVGLNFIDTAECYGDHTSEELIGLAIRRDRANWIVATKFGHRFHGHLNRTDERKPSDALTQVEASLKALRTEYIDLLQYHSIRDSEYDNDELTSVLQGLLKSGKVRHLGNSISSGIDPKLQVESAGERGVKVLQVIYNRLDRRPEEKIFPSALRQDLGMLARVPLASGFLSGKYKPGATFEKNDVRSDKKPAELKRTLREVEQIAKSEVPPNVPMAQWALAWCLQHPAMTAVIPGCKSVEQVRSNAAAAELPMVLDNHPQAWK